MVFDKLKEFFTKRFLLGDEGEEESDKIALVALENGQIWPGFECSHCGNASIDSLIPPEDSDPKKPAYCQKCHKYYFLR